ncbi:MAG: NAD-binding protein [Gammaproteobacteria bacterium]|jgi:Trk K+ transport system NAD-binding subunit|nr:NAD-binding protein [Gammaproteobacteria bacterium]
MARPVFRFDPELSWKSWSAIILFACGFLPLVLGVGVSDRPGVPEADLFTKAYYAVGLFILGGMDLGTPAGGPLYARILLWVAYFGAPAWTASAVFETILYALRPPVWQIRTIKNKIVITGGGELTLGFLNRIRAADDPRRVIVIVDEAQHPHLDALRSYRGVRVVVVSGDQLHRLRRFPLHKAHKFLLLSERDETNFEVASLLLAQDPQLGPKIVYHVSNLRFLRVLQGTRVVEQCTTFNQYELAATQLVRLRLMRRFRETKYKDTVVLAGFGRFGQSILEQLEQHASGTFNRVAIIDRDAKQRAMIADEEVEGKRKYSRHTYEGDIDDPEVWRRLFKEVITGKEEPVFVITTGNDQTNLRCAIWLRKNFPRALIISRTLSPSYFAKGVCEEHDVVSVNTAELVEASIPHAWYR